MRVIDADVLFDVLHDRMKGAEEWITRAETDELKARAEGFLSALIEIKLSIEDEVTTIEAEPVRRGKWNVAGNTTHYYICSICGKPGDCFDNYCRSCGARMDGEA